MWWWTACVPTPPDAWEGIDQAVVGSADQVIVDRTSSRRNEDGTVVRTVDRCRWERGREVLCVVGPRERSTLSRKGELLLDERYDDEHHRVLHVLDPETLRDRRVVPLGLEPEGRVPGGSWFAEGDGLLVFVNHGLSGVDVAERQGRASFTVERRDGGDAPTWRRGLLRWPQEAHHVPGWLAVLDQGEWRTYDTATGEVRVAPTAGGPGACLGDDALTYVSADVPPAIVTLPRDGGPPTLRPWPGGPRPTACVLRDGAPWFHGGDGEGGGFVLGPDGVSTPVPRVDLELGQHVDADGAFWLVELGRGFVPWDPVTRAVRGAPRELHDVVRVGDDLVAYGVGVDLGLWITSRGGEWRRPNRLSPRPWHVDGRGRLWTFAHRKAPDQPLVEILSLPQLEVLDALGDWPAPE